MAKFAAKDSNKNITLSPHGTGKVVVGTGAADATVQSDGNHNLVLQTGNSTTGSISITDGADGDIAISPNGTGTVVVNTDLDVDNININGNAITSTDTDGNIDLTPNGTGEVNISKVDIDSGAVDGITLGTNSAVTEAQIDNINVNGNAITSTNTDGNIDLTPNGTGEVNISKVDIDAGTIDGATIATSDITVGSSKTLNVSAGTLTTSTAQKDAIVDGSTAISRSGNNLTFAGTVGNTGNNTITSGNIIIGTAGKGIDFSLAQSNASGTTDEILSGYERGTFTPTIQRDSNTLTYTPHANDRGNYIRIGDLVYLNGYLRGTFSGGSGGYRIAGTSQGNLPFTVSTGTYAFIQSPSTASNLGTSSVNTNGIYAGTLSSGNQYGFFCLYYTTD